jgi:hypothetical protein
LTLSNDFAGDCHQHFAVKRSENNQICHVGGGLLGLLGFPLTCHDIFLKKRLYKHAKLALLCS